MITEEYLIQCFKEAVSNQVDLSLLLELTYEQINSSKINLSPDNILTLSDGEKIKIDFTCFEKAVETFYQLLKKAKLCDETLGINSIKYNTGFQIKYKNTTFYNPVIIFGQDKESTNKLAGFDINFGLIHSLIDHYTSNRNFNSINEEGILKCKLDLLKYPEAINNTEIQTLKGCDSRYKGTIVNVTGKGVSGTDVAFVTSVIEGGNSFNYLRTFFKIDLENSIYNDYWRQLVAEDAASKDSAFIFDEKGENLRVLKHFALRIYLEKKESIKDLQQIYYKFKTRCKDSYFELRDTGRTNNDEIHLNELRSFANCLDMKKELERLENLQKIKAEKREEKNRRRKENRKKKQLNI